MEWCDLCDEKIDLPERAINCEVCGKLVCIGCQSDTEGFCEECRPSE